MNALLAVLAFLLTALPIAAQTKILVAKNRTPIAFARDYPGGIAYPTICDEQERLYVKATGRGPGMVGPLFRVSARGVVEAEFDTTGALVNRYAARPDGGVIMVHSDGRTKFIDNFGPDGTRESSLPLERPPVPFWPSQLAVFRSGEILVSGMQIRTTYKASTAIFDSTGHLVKQLVLDGDAAIENAIAEDTDAQKRNSWAIDTSVAITGDDGLAYLMRATSPGLPVTVYAISPDGEVVHQIVVRAPSPKAGPNWGIRVGKNRLAVQFTQSCGGASSDSCRPQTYTVVDATTGKQLAVYEAAKEAEGTMACFVPNPDRFLIFSQNQHGLDIVEAEPK
jgi:hypothetical protein